MSLFGIGGPSDHKRSKRWDELGEILERHDDGLDAEAFSKYVDDPVAFARDILGVELWSKQQEIAESVRDRPQVVCRGGNTVGKDYASAAIGLWWVYCRRGRVLVTSAKFDQLRINFMAKVRSMWLGARARGNPLRGETRVTGLVEVDPDEELIGIHCYTASDASSGTGDHFDPMLCIGSEGQGLPEFAFEIFYANATGPRDRILIVGNPLHAAGDFYNISRAKAWHSIKIPMAEHPNILEGQRVIPIGPSAEGIERLAAYGLDSPQYQARVLAEFPSGLSDYGIFSREMLEAVTNPDRWVDLADAARRNKAEPKVAIDVGRDVDRSVITYGKGSAVLKFIVIPPTHDLMELVAKIEAAIRPYGFRWGKLGTRFKRYGQVVVDATGIGAGVADRLEQIGYYVKRFVGAQKAKRDDCANARAESYWTLRERCQACTITWPDNDELLEELLAHEYRLNPQDKIQVVDKATVKAAIGRSPDLSDSLAMWIGTRYQGPPRMPPVYYSA